MLFRKMQRTAAFVESVLMLVVLTACGEREAPQPSAGAGAGGAGSGLGAGAGGPLDGPVNEFGYSIVGGDEYPPLFQRVKAQPCEGVQVEIGVCATDADCGLGFACVCGVTGVGLFGSQCMPAECRSQSDCDGGRCLVSVGNRANECCEYGKLGLFCSRAGSTCQEGLDCLGNGRACAYDVGTDRFACQPFGCSCGS
jgi:hypothetical protein